MVSFLGRKQHLSLSFALALVYQLTMKGPFPRVHDFGTYEMLQSAVCVCVWVGGWVGCLAEGGWGVLGSGGGGRGFTRLPPPPLLKKWPGVFVCVCVRVCVTPKILRSKFLTRPTKTSSSILCYGAVLLGMISRNA